MRARRGVTMLEIAIVVAIIGILAAVGAGTLRDKVPQWRSRRVAMEFAQAVNDARILAIADGTEYRILLSTADASLDDDTEWAGAYYIQKGDASHSSTTWDTLPVDMDGSDANWSLGYVDIGEGGEDEMKWVSLAQWGTIDGPGTDNANAIVFSPRGWVSNPTSDFSYDADSDGTSDGYIGVDFYNKYAWARGEVDRWSVIISRGGLPRLQNSHTAPSGHAAGSTGETWMSGGMEGYTGGSADGSSDGSDDGSSDDGGSDTGSGLLDGADLDGLADGFD
jgi:prepilin-type N-terminal cleavage/methylation domain-containing protein